MSIHLPPHAAHELGGLNALFAVPCGCKLNASVAILLPSTEVDLT